MKPPISPIVEISRTSALRFLYYKKYLKGSKTCSTAQIFWNQSFLQRTGTAKIRQLLPVVRVPSTTNPLGIVVVISATVLPSE